MGMESYNKAGYKMKFLLVSMTPLVYNNSATLRTCGYISGLYKEGHTVDVLTPSYNESDFGYDETNNDFIRKYVNEYYTFERGSIYSTLGTKKETNKNWIKQLMKKIVRKVYSFAKIYDSQKVLVSKVITVDIKIDNYDRIISVSDPKSSHLLVIELFKKRKMDVQVEWIQCWGDPWYLDITGPSGLIKKTFIKHEEQRVLSKASTIIYTSPFTLLTQQILYPEYANLMICVNQSCKEYANEKKEETVKYEVGYFGAYNSHVRDIMPLYECCNENNITLCIAGNSDITLESTQWCDVKGKISFKDAENEEMKCDILVCVCNLQGTQIPGKIYYCAGYDKNIIIAVDGECAEDLIDYFKTFNRYIICKNSKEDILKAINEARKNRYNNKGILDQRLSDTYFAKVICNEE